MQPKAMKHDAIYLNSSTVGCSAVCMLKNVYYMTFSQNRWVISSRCAVTPIKCAYERVKCLHDQVVT